MDRDRRQLDPRGRRRRHRVRRPAAGARTSIPTQVTLAELVREVGGEAAEFAERDAIERAVRDLTGAGLLHRHDAFVLPTRAALRFSELLDR